MPAALAPVAIVGSITSLCVGATLARLMFVQVGVGGTTLYRVGFAALILLLWWRPWRHPMTPAQRRQSILFGIALGAMNLSFYSALRTLPLGVAIALEFTGPLAVSIAGSRRPVDAVWILLAATGVALLLPLWQFSTPLDPVGIALALLAGVLWATYIVLGKRVSAEAAGPGLAWALTAATVFVLPFGLWNGAALLDARLLGSGLLLAILSSLIPYSLEILALRHLSPATFSILLSLEPAVGALADRAIAGHELSAVQCAAIGCVVAASVGKAWHEQHARPAPADGL